MPIVEVQQNAWAMTSPVLKSVDAQKREIRERTDWLLGGAGFDFVSTESGFDEFFHPSCEAMLGLMNELASYAFEAHGATSYIKVHSSAGQTCEDLDDPRDGTPLNFNFLPIFADGHMAVLPHPVQAYALDDPTGGAYGNLNYSAMLDFAAFAGSTGRDVVYHPETNYWVNVDIDVPLFLPLYGLQRKRDLELLSRRGAALAGQNVFDSGWEWGAWLSDVVAARAAWDPTPTFREALAPVAQALGGGPRVTGCTMR